MDDRVLGLILSGLWIAWLLYWLVSARKVKQSTWQESASSQLRHRIPLMLAAYLVIAPSPPPAFMTTRFLPRAPWTELIGVGLVVAGLAFAIWARRVIGTNWSASVTVKKEHALVRSGPYALVRHPIYSGMLLAFAGTAVAMGELKGIVAFALTFVAFVVKSRVEEERMSGVFPEYSQYRRDTAALIPFVL